MIFYLSILRIIIPLPFSISKFLKTDMTFFCCFVLSFQYISKLCHWPLWKHFSQVISFTPSSACYYKLLHTIFTTVHLHWIKNISISKCAVYTPSRQCIVLIFSVYGFLPLCCVFFWFIFSQYCSSTGFNMLSKSAYGINGKLNWYWLLWNFKNFSFSEGIFTLMWPLLLQVL